jgi:hypothetical protein
VDGDVGKIVEGNLGILRGIEIEQAFEFLLRDDLRPLGCDPGVVKYSGYLGRSALGRDVLGDCDDAIVIRGVIELVFLIGLFAGLEQPFAWVRIGK